LLVVGCWLLVVGCWLLVGFASSANVMGKVLSKTTTNFWLQT